MMLLVKLFATSRVAAFFFYHCQHIMLHRPMIYSHILVHVSQHVRNRLAHIYYWHIQPKHTRTFALTVQERHICTLDILEKY